MADLVGEGAAGPAPVTQEQIVQAIFGWMALFVMLIVVSDVPGLGELAAGFAWLLLLSIVIVYGPDALNNLTRTVNIK